MTPLRTSLVITLAALAGVTACRRATEPAEQADVPVGVTIATARTDTLRDLATAPGTVVPSPAGDWTISSDEPAQVAELPKKEGDTVATGDLLVHFQVASLSQELAARELALADATAHLDQAKAEAARLEDLFGRGLTARNTFEASRGSVGSAEAAVGQARAELELARLQEGRTRVRARFPGVVLKVWHVEGDQVSGLATDPVLRVVDPAHVQVAVQLPVTQLARVLPGQLATVRAIVDGVDRPGTVAQKQSAVDPTAPTGEVRVAFTGPSTLPLDSPASVDILLDQRTGALIVPVAAISRASDGSMSVMVAGDDGRAHHREVRTGLVTRDFAQIVTGLAAGERVIVSNLDGITEGTRVTTAK